MNSFKHIFILVAGILGSIVPGRAQNNTPWSTTGNIGIGTTSPAVQLHLSQNDTGGQGMRIENLNASGTYKYVTISQLGSNAYGISGWPNAGILEGAANGGLVISAYAGDIKFQTSDNRLTRMVINNTTGYVGIGTGSPAEKLDVNGNIKTTGFILPTGAAAGKVLTSDANGNATWQTAAGSSSGWALGGNTTGAATTIGNTDGYDLRIVTAGSERIRVLADGRVAIGNPTNLPAADAKLAVYGNIYSTKVKVTQTGWADYVFHQDYRLRPLSEVEQYIRQHQHLPEVPSAAEVEKDGLDVGDNQATLLKKIEELTLYVIDLNKEVQDLKKQLKQKETRQSR